MRVTYSGHSTFLIESPQGVRIATDYNDYIRPSVVPDIATMNHAHDSHFTNFPDPRIPHVLRGWGSNPNEPARHDVQVRDVHVRNVPTNIRSWNGGTELHGNSIFVFETANMCIGHLGHLHHTLNQQQLNELGRLDVLFVPVDGNLTLDLDGMLDVLTSIKALLQRLYAAPLPRARTPELAGGNVSSPHLHAIEDDAADNAKGAGIARALGAKVADDKERHHQR